MEAIYLGLTEPMKNGFIQIVAFSLVYTFFSKKSILFKRSLGVGICFRTYQSNETKRVHFNLWDKNKEKNKERAFCTALFNFK